MPFSDSDLSGYVCHLSDTSPMKNCEQVFPLPDLMEGKYVSLDMLSFWHLACNAGTHDLKCLHGSSHSLHSTVK